MYTTCSLQIRISALFLNPGRHKNPFFSILKGTWQWGGFSWVFAEIGSSWLPYTTFPAVPIFASNSRRYSYSKNNSPLSLIRGVTDSPHHWYAETATPRITDTESWLLNFLEENSLYRWYGESSTPRASDTVSRRLLVSLSQGFDNSAYHWYGESPTPHFVESESRRLHVSVIRGVAIWRKKISLASISSTLNG